MPYSAPMKFTRRKFFKLIGAVALARVLPPAQCAPRFMGVPLRVDDQLRCTEATVT